MLNFSLRTCLRMNFTYTCLVTCIILVITNISVSHPCYKIENVTTALGILLESPQWSVQENALYWVDLYGQRLYRMDAKTCDITYRDVCYGTTSLVVPVRNHPGYLAVAVRSSLYLLKWGAPGGDSALRQLTTVDNGKPDNNIDDGKADAYGRLWFGTFGKFNLSSPLLVPPDQATLYSINECDYARPAIKLRPVSLSNGIAWSLDNKRMYYNDSPTRKVAVFDYDLATGDISNMRTLFDFNENDIPGFPDGMTIDVDDNLWVATFFGRRLLKISSTSGQLLDDIELPVDQVSSVMFGGRDLATLYVTTGRREVANPMPLSGSILAITKTGTRGRPENQFLFPNAPNY